eukprot:11926083-Ditylum_brightwellii.AAC.1
MFHNYWLDRKVRPFAGVDLTILNEDAKATLQHRHWTRLMMGLTDSPYLSMKAFLWGEEIIHSDQLDKKNPLRWDFVQLNLPGDPKYDPPIAWARKFNLLAACIANDFITYYDDVRLTGDGRNTCIAAMRQVGALLNHLGQQEAARKTRPPTGFAPGAWAGKFFRTDPKLGLFVTTSVEKWIWFRTL